MPASLPVFCSSGRTDGGRVPADTIFPVLSRAFDVRGVRRAAALLPNFSLPAAPCAPWTSALLPCYATLRRCLSCYVSRMPYRACTTFVSLPFCSCLITLPAVPSLLPASIQHLIPAAGLFIARLALVSTFCFLTIAPTACHACRNNRRASVALPVQAALVRIQTPASVSHLAWRVAATAGRRRLGAWLLQDVERRSRHGLFLPSSSSLASHCSPPFGGSAATQRHLTAAAAAATLRRRQRYLPMPLLPLYKTA